MVSWPASLMYSHEEHAPTSSVELDTRLLAFHRELDPGTRPHRLTSLATLPCLRGEKSRLSFGGLHEQGDPLLPFVDPLLRFGRS